MLLRREFRIPWPGARKILGCAKDDDFIIAWSKDEDAKGQPYILKPL